MKNNGQMSEEYLLIVIAIVSVFFLSIILFVIPSVSSPNGRSTTFDIREPIKGETQ